MNENATVGPDKISEIRKNRVEEDIVKVFDSSSMAREIVNVRDFDIRDSQKEFLRIGIATITDKIWFVDNTGGQEYYSYETLGHGYGVAIAEGELKEVLNRILEVAKPENKIKVKGEIKNTDIAAALGSRGMVLHAEPIILTSLYDQSDFWYIPEFKGEQEKTYFGVLDNSGKRIPVFRSRLVPKGTTLIIDKSKIGTLIIKKLLQVSIEDIGKSSEEEKKEIMNNLPSLKDLDEKVKIQVYEVIRFELEDSNAVVVLQKDEPERI